MAVLSVPSRQGESHYTQVTTLEGVQYALTFDWVQRWQRWTLAIATSGGTELATGLPVVVGVNLLAHVKHIDGMPQGFLGVYDTQLSFGEPALDNFYVGGDYYLIYVEDE